MKTIKVSFQQMMAQTHILVENVRLNSEAVVAAENAAEQSIELLAKHGKLLGSVFPEQQQHLANIDGIIKTYRGEEETDEERIVRIQAEMFWLRANYPAAFNAAAAFPIPEEIVAQANANDASVKYRQETEQKAEEMKKARGTEDDLISRMDGHVPIIFKLLQETAGKNQEPGYLEKLLGEKRKAFIASMLSNDMSKVPSFNPDLSEILNKVTEPRSVDWTKIGNLPNVLVITNNWDGLPASENIITPSVNFAKLDYVKNDRCPCPAHVAITAAINEYIETIVQTMPSSYEGKREVDADFRVGAIMLKAQGYVSNDRVVCNVFDMLTGKRFSSVEKEL